MTVFITHHMCVYMCVECTLHVLITHDMCVYMCVECTLHVLITHHMCAYMCVECTVEAYCVLLLLHHMGEIFKMDVK